MSRFVTVAESNSLREGSGRCVKIGNQEIALFRVGDEFYAIDNECTHYGASLCHGMVQGHKVACPWHCWQFDMTNGKCLTVPGRDVKSYPVRVEDGAVQIEVEEAPIPAEATAS